MSVVRRGSDRLHLHHQSVLWLAVPAACGPVSFSPRIFRGAHKTATLLAGPLPRHATRRTNLTVVC